jgi:hypothetical protein
MLPGTSSSQWKLSLTSRLLDNCGDAVQGGNNDRPARR